MADTHHDYTTDDDDEPLVNTSALVFAVITLAVYILFLRPTAEETPQRQQQAQRGTQPPQQRQRTPRQPQQRQTPTPRAAAAAAAAQPQRARKVSLSDNAIEILSQCQRLPPHVAAASTSSSSTTIGGFHALNESGLVAFSHTKAASSANAQPQHLRKARAKILSRLLPVGSKPPSKGSTFVLGLSHKQHLQEEEQLEAVRAVISCLSLHYTVLVICHLESAGNSDDDYTKSHQSVVEQLQLENHVLPEHRILLSSTPGGRVALVRQLSSNVGLTVDFDMSVQIDLQRFGFNVTVVDNWKTII